MRYFFGALVSVCLLAVGPALSFGQCGPRGCAVANTFVSMPAANVNYGWFTKEGMQGELFLYWGNQLCGKYSFRDGYYREPSNTGWSAPKTAPIDIPFTTGPAGQQGHYAGVDLSGLSKVETFSHNGHTAPKSEIEAAIAGKIPDDGKQPHATYIDPDKTRRDKVAEAFRTLRENGKVTDGVRFQVYDPNLKQSKSMLKPLKLDDDVKFKQAGHVLAMQPPDTEGKGHSQTTNYYGEVTDDVLFDALRKILPNMPKLPDVIPSVPSLSDLPWEPVVVLISLVFAAVAFVHSQHD